MAKLNSNQIRENVKRSEVVTNEVGESLITKALAGTGLSISNTGSDVGTGDVTLSLNTAYTDNRYAVAGHNHDGTYLKRTATFQSSDNVSVDNFSNGETFDYNTGGSGFWGPLLSFGGHSGQYDAQLHVDYNNANSIMIRSHNADTSSWSPWRRVWHSGNQGHNSGMNADTLDGLHASDILTGGQDATFGTTYHHRLYQRASGIPSNNLGGPSITEMALFDQQFTNKTWFYDISKISFEYTTDGVNWLPYAVNEGLKKQFVSGKNDAWGINIPHNSCQKFRIIVSNDGNYVFLNALYMYWSSNGNSAKVKILKRRTLDSQPWEYVSDSDVLVDSWPGHLYLPFDTVPFSQSPSQYQDVAIEFIPTWSQSMTYAIDLLGMEIWGGYPSGKRTIYDWDQDKNVMFPGKVELNFPSSSGASSLVLRTDNQNVANGTIRWRGADNTNQAAIGSVYNVSDQGCLEFLSGTTTHMVMRSNGKIGIGNKNPNARLDLVGNMMLRVSEDAGNRTEIYNDDHKTVFTSYSVDPNSYKQDFVFLPAGKMGIGTTSPQELLHVNGNAIITNNVSLGKLVSEYHAVSGGFGDIVNNAPWYGLGLSNVETAPGNHQYIVQLAGYYGLALKTGGGQVDIDGAGNVGVGIAPSEKLHIWGNVLVEGADYSRMLKIRTYGNYNQQPKIVLETYVNGVTASEINHDYYGSLTDAQGYGHGLNYISGRPSFSNHWFRNANKDVMAVIQDKTVAINANTVLNQNSKFLVAQIGVNTINPAEALEVIGNSRVSGNINMGGTLLIGQYSGDAQKQLLLDYDETNNYATIQAIQQGVAYKNLLLNSSGGFVGVGTTDPLERFHVGSGNILLDNNYGYSWKDSGGNVRRTMLLSGSNDFHFGPVDAGWGGMTYVHAGTHMAFMVNKSSGSPINSLILDNAGRVGVGVWPSEAFQVAGSIKASGNINSSIGTYLSSDANNHYFMSPNTLYLQGGNRTVYLTSSEFAPVGPVNLGSGPNRFATAYLSGIDLSGNLTASTPNSLIKNFSVLPAGYIENSPINFRFDQDVLRYANRKAGVTATLSGFNASEVDAVFSSYADFLNLANKADGSYIELTGLTENNSANAEWYPYIFFHSGSVPRVVMEIKTSGSANWQVMYDGAADSYYIHKASCTGGTLTGARWTFYGMGSNNSYVRSLGVIGRNSNAYQWNIMKGGDTMYGDLTMHNSRLISDIPTGTAPFTVASTTVVTNLNADLLDGIESAKFIYGTHLNGVSGLDGSFDLNAIQKAGFYRVWDTINAGSMAHSDLINLGRVDGNPYSSQIGIKDGKMFIRTLNNGTWTDWSTVWTNTNDGASSGLDADKLDGYHASAFAPLAHSHSLMGLDDINPNITPDSGYLLAYDLTNSFWDAVHISSYGVSMEGHVHPYLPLTGGTVSGGITTSGTGFLRCGSGGFKTSSGNVGLSGTFTFYDTGIGMDMYQTFEDGILVDYGVI